MTIYYLNTLDYIVLIELTRNFFIDASAARTIVRYHIKFLCSGARNESVN